MPCCHVVRALGVLLGSVAQASSAIFSDGANAHSMHCHAARIVECNIRLEYWYLRVTLLVREHSGLCRHVYGRYGRILSHAACLPSSLLFHEDMEQCQLRSGFKCKRARRTL